METLPIFLGCDTEVQSGHWACPHSRTNGGKILGISQTPRPQALSQVKQGGGGSE